MKTAWKELKKPSRFNNDAFEKKLTKALGKTPKPHEISTEERSRFCAEHFEVASMMRAAMTLVSTRNRVAVKDLEIVRSHYDSLYVRAHVKAALTPGIHSMELGAGPAGNLDFRTFHYVLVGKGRFCILSAAESKCCALHGLGPEMVKNFLYRKQK